MKLSKSYGRCIWLLLVTLITSSLSAVVQASGITVFNPIADLKDAQKLEQGINIMQHTRDAAEYIKSLESKMTGSTRYSSQVANGLIDYINDLEAIQHAFPNLELPDGSVAKLDLPIDVREILDNNVFGKGVGDGGFYDQTKRVFRQKLYKNGIQYSTVILANARKRAEEAKRLANQANTAIEPKDYWGMTNAILLRIEQSQQHMVTLLSHILRVQAAAIYEGVDSFELANKREMNKYQRLRYAITHEIGFKKARDIECTEQLQSEGWCP